MSHYTHSQNSISSDRISLSSNAGSRQVSTQDLARFALFHGVSKNELDTISLLLQPRFIGAGITFIQQGCSGTGLFLLQEGTVKVCLAPAYEKGQASAHQQSDTILAFCGPGESLGEIDAADGSGHTASVMTLESSQFQWMAVDDFRRCCAILPQVQRNLSLLLAARVRRLTTYNAALAALPLPGKIAYSLLLLAYCYGEMQQDDGILLPLRLTQEELAALVGSSREATNRILAGFKRAGHITVDDKGYFLIQKPNLLREYCPNTFPIPRF